MSFLVFNRQFDGRTVGMSIWFRLPSDAIAAVRKRDAVTLSNNEDVEVMDHVVPIIMLGPQNLIPVEDWTFPNAECFNDPNPEHPPSLTRLGYITGVRSVPSQQSCIGVRCHPGSDPSNPLPPSLYVHIQAGNGPRVPPFYVAEFGPGFSCPVYPDFDPIWGLHPIPVFKDAAYIFERPLGGALGNSSIVSTTVLPGGAFGGTPEITPDRWHHLMLSWTAGAESSRDMTVDEFLAGNYGNTVGQHISTSSRLHCVLDGKDKNGFDLPGTWIGSFSDGSAPFDPNAVCCGTVFNNAASVYDPDRANVITRGPQTVSVVTMNYGSIPVAPLWIPGSPKIQTKKRGLIVGNQHIELGECQIFDQLLTARRLDLFLNDAGEPEKMNVAERNLGKPLLRLHGSGNWKKGKNTGTLGSVFEPTGEIPKYKPNPNLYGPQTPADLKK